MTLSAQLSRRQFCQTAFTAASVCSMARAGFAYCRQIPKVRLGKTGLAVSRIGMDTSLLHWASSRQEAQHLTRILLDAGVNYIDTAPYYGTGYAEGILGEILAPQRDRTVMVTKTRSWDARSALRDLEGSLKRLQTDFVDIWLLDNPPVRHQESILSSTGTLAAMQKAMDQGKCRFAGLSGQSHPQWTLEYIKQYPFDVVQLPLNAVDPHYLSFEKEALPQLNTAQTAIVGGKTYAVEALRNTTRITHQAALHYALSLPVTVTLVNPFSKQQARDDLHAFYQYDQPLSDEQKQRIVSQTRTLSSRDIEWYKAMG